MRLSSSSSSPSVLFQALGPYTHNTHNTHTKTHMKQVNYLPSPGQLWCFVWLNFVYESIPLVTQSELKKHKNSVKPTKSHYMLGECLERNRVHCRSPLRLNNAVRWLQHYLGEQSISQAGGTYRPAWAYTIDFPPDFDSELSSSHSSVLDKIDTDNC